MARFYLTAVNGRGNTNSIGGRSSVQSAHVRGWNAGVEVECVKCINENGDEYDRFDVYMTPGSSGAGHRVLVGQVTEMPKRRPRWLPAKGKKSTV
jgi:hypothetical protein